MVPFPDVPIFIIKRAVKNICEESEIIFCYSRVPRLATCDALTFNNSHARKYLMHL